MSTRAPAMTFQEAFEQWAAESDEFWGAPFYSLAEISLEQHEAEEGCWTPVEMYLTGDRRAMVCFGCGRVWEGQA